MPHLPHAPSLYASILAQARLNPHAPAVVHEEGLLTYRDMCVHIERMTRSLHALRIPPGSRVVVEIGMSYLAHVIIIALSRLGLPSASTNQREIVKPGLVLTAEPDAMVDGYPARQVRPEWTGAAADALPAFVEQPHPENALARIVLSSGTTGVSKMVAFTYRQLHERIRAIGLDYHFTPATRLFTSMSLSTVSGSVLPPTVWATGGTMVFSKNPGPAVLRSRPNVLFMSTAQLEGFVGSMSPEHLPQPAPVVYVAGSALPLALNQRTRQRLSSQLMMVYGSTEAGTVALAPAAHVDSRPGLTGYVMPPAEVEIVDDSHQPLAPGMVGQLRVRQPGQVEAYLDDDETTARSFRGGWFYPGDLATLGPGGDLSIVGRASELMNFNGVKVAPTAMEEKLGPLRGTSEWAVCAVRTAEGDRPVLAVVVSGPEFSEQSVAGIYREAYPRLPELRIVRVAQLPRNDMGKVMRAELAKLVGTRPAG